MPFLSSRLPSVTLTGFSGTDFQVRGNLAAPLGKGFLLGNLNGSLDAVNGLGVALGDDRGHTVLGFGAIHGVGLPAVQEREPTGDQNLLLILKFLHFHLPP